jgi:drug/metabolite transporter (DMT)-like permease
MVAVDGMLADAEPLHARQWAGMACGFIGIVLLVWPEIAASHQTTAHLSIGVTALQIACLGWAVASAQTRRHVVRRDILGAAALQMFFGGVFMMIAAIAMMYLTVAGSIVAFVCYSYALNHLPVAVVSLYTYVNPVIAVALGVLWLHEPFERRQLLAAAVIAVGVTIVKTGRSVATGEEPVHE